MQTMSRARPVAVYRPRGRIFIALVGALYRFLAGQVVLRRPGRWDSRYTMWAPAVPDHVDQGREPAPRSTWARRPGYQRQLARLAAILALVGYYTARELTVAAVAVLVAAAIARAIVMAYRRHIFAPVIASWWDYVAGKTGATGDPLRWVKFPTAEEIRWEPVTPLAALTRPDSGRDEIPAEAAEDISTAEIRRRRDKGGLLTRLCPPLARLLRPMAAPITEWGWVVAARDRFAGDRRLWVALLARSLEVLIRAAERSRAVRVWPHVIRRGLGADDARVEIYYPPTYPAHPQDIAEIQRVLRDRLPARDVDQDAPPDDDEDDEDDADEAALPAGAWVARNEHRNLRIVFERSKLMPADVHMGKADFVRFPFHTIPIGIELTRKGRRRLVTIPLKAKTPHVSVAASTGWGKTTTANVISAHLLYHGAYGIFVDPKRVGYVDAYRGASPYIEIRTTLPGWIDAYERVRNEMNRRYDLMEQCADRVQKLGLPKMTENAELYFQPLFLNDDEKGSLVTAIMQWFKREGGPDGKPGRGMPPTIEYDQEILWRGRAGAVHRITQAQQNNAKVFVNTDMRDQYMFRILLGPQTRQSWEMTFPGTKKRSIPRKKGRGIYGVGPGGIREIQLGRISDAEARECAIHGIAVADRENQARAELLALATGRPVWEVSPLPYWVTPPVQTAAGVPGQDTEEDAPARPQERGLSLVKTPAVDADDGFLDDETAELDADEDDDEAIDAETDLIVGEAAAADFLGISQAAFRQRRKRAKKGLCPEIPGEVPVGRSLAWPALELREWNNQFRSAS